MKFPMTCSKVSDAMYMIEGNYPAFKTSVTASSSLILETKFLETLFLETLFLETLFLETLLTEMLLTAALATSSVVPVCLQKLVEMVRACWRRS